MTNSQVEVQPKAQPLDLEVYQGQFGEFTITADDRQGVLIYRAGLMVAALSFALGTGLVLWQGNIPLVLAALTPLYVCFCLALAVSLLTVHIYLAPLHRTLQIFWGIGVLAAIALEIWSPKPLALTVYSHPAAILGIGFTFAALAGIFFKEAFCFNRLETKLLTPLVPLVLLGHLTSILPASWERVLLAVWALLFIVFALRKVTQPIPPDMGDKSVFAHLQRQQQQKSARA